MGDAAHSTEPSTVVSPGMAQRASDLERRAVVDHLRAATSEGRLTLDEFEERVSVRSYGAFGGVLVRSGRQVP
jgi:hypothetical protein